MLSGWKRGRDGAQQATVARQSMAASVFTHTVARRAVVLAVLRATLLVLLLLRKALLKMHQAPAGPAAAVMHHLGSCIRLQLLREQALVFASYCCTRCAVRRLRRLQQVREAPGRWLTWWLRGGRVR
jgi:hypothetical protein